MLPISLLSLTLLLFGSLLGLTIHDSRLTTDLYQTEQAAYLAEAALLQAQRLHARDPTWRGTLEQTLGPGRCRLRVYDLNGIPQAEGIGEVGTLIAKRALALTP